MKRFFVAIVFLFFLFGFAVANLLTPDRDFSPLENRYLAALPRFSIRSLFAGEWTGEFETYLNDQFPLRDSWIAVKSGTERLLGKKENNGVFLLSDTLIEKFDACDENRLRNNAAAVAAFVEKAGLPACVALIPTGAYVLRDRLPEGAPNLDQTALIETAYGQVGAAGVDVLSALCEHAEEGVYYTTDHHWTTRGAYYGYAAIARAMNLTPPEPEAYQPELASDSFYGTLFSNSGARYLPPDEIWFWVPDADVTALRYEDGQMREGGVYQRQYLSEKDAYKAFLGGNQPLIVLRGPKQDAPRLLVLRDSFADSMALFLTEHFSEVHLVDLRYYKENLLDYLEENQIDRILVAYNIKNFAEDTNLFALKKAA